MEKKSISIEMLTMCGSLITGQDVKAPRFLDPLNLSCKNATN